jgi:hypothetical protein
MAGAVEGYQVAVDLGDAFTECVIREPAGGRCAAGRAPVRRGDPAGSVLAAVGAAAAELGVPVREILARADGFVHGFAVAAGALGAGRDGSRTAYVTTLGPHEPPAPGLITAGCTIRAVERIDYRGRTVIALTAAAVADVVAQVRAARADAVAVCLLWSFLAPEHERRLAAALRRALPEVYVSAAVDVAPVLGEEERGIATALNAALGRPVAAYLTRLDRLLRDAGLTAPVLLMTATGAVVPAAEVLARPICLMEGAATGAAFAGGGDPDVRLDGAGARAALLGGRLVRAVAALAETGGGAPAPARPAPPAGPAGDPLRRAPEAVAGDHRAGRCSIDEARRRHGVVLTEDGEVDGPATAVCRDAMRAARLVGSVPASELLERYGAEGVLSGLGG